MARIYFLSGIKMMLCLWPSTTVDIGAFVKVYLHSQVSHVVERWLEIIKQSKQKNKNP